MCNLLASYYGVKIRWSDDKDMAGAGYVRRGNREGEYIMTLSRIRGRSHHLSTFFHEMGHVFAMRTGKWKEYHNDGVKRYGTVYFTERILRAKIATAYRAECWMDKWATEELKRMWPNIPYRAGYLGNPASKMWLDEHHTSFYRIWLKFLCQKKKKRS